MIHFLIQRCRSCDGRDLAPVLNLGNLCVSDFVTGDAEPPRAPLELVRCTACGLVQLRHSVDRDLLYRRYHYRSGVNETMVAALADVAACAQRHVALAPGDIVIDVGANDGTLLRQFPKETLRYGFEPSDIADEGRVGGNRVIRMYFPPPYTPDQIFGRRRAKVITSVAMFYDVDGVNRFVDAIADWLAPDGVWIVQFQDLASMLACNGFDNICHEHVAYWSLSSLTHLLHRHGLRVVETAHVPINGGSLRVVVGRAQPGDVPAPLPPDDPWSLSLFAARTEALRFDTVQLLRRLRAEGRTILGYAASTKANTLLQYYGIGSDLVEAFMERSPHKWGTRTVGTNIPIISEDEGRARRPDYLLIGAWQFLDAFVERERALLDAGTRLIVPLPTLRIVGDGAVTAVAHAA